MSGGRTQPYPLERQPRFAHQLLYGYDPRPSFAEGRVVHPLYIPSRHVIILMMQVVDHRNPDPKRGTRLLRKSVIP